MPHLGREKLNKRSPLIDAVPYKCLTAALIKKIRLGKAVFIERKADEVIFYIVIVSHRMALEKSDCFD